MRRIIIVLGLLGVILVVPGVASAKVPPFTIDVFPSAPAPGGTISLTVRFWIDAGQTTPSDWPDMRSLDDFLRVRRVGAEAYKIPVDLERVRPGVYLGHVTLPTAGQWEVCPLSCSRRGLDLPGYADPIEVLVTPPPPPDTGVGADEAPASRPAGSSSASSWTLAILVAAIAAVWVLAAVARRRWSDPRPGIVP